jgi:hypothetical protein
MNELVGYVLALLTCYGSEYNCDIKQVTDKVYTTQSECEWDRQNRAAYYRTDELKCAEVRRPR